MTIILTIGIIGGCILGLIGFANFILPHFLKWWLITSTGHQDIDQLYQAFKHHHH